MSPKQWESGGWRMVIVNESLERLQIPGEAWSLPLLCPLSGEPKQRQDRDQEQKDVEALCVCLTSSSSASAAVSYTPRSRSCFYYLELLFANNRNQFKKMAKGKEQAERRYLKAVEVFSGSQEPNCSLAIRGSGLDSLRFCFRLGVGFLLL